MRSLYSYIFLVLIEDKVIYQRWLRRKMAQGAWKFYLCCLICIFLHQTANKLRRATKKVFVLFCFCLFFFYKKQILSNFLRNYGFCL